MWCCSGGDGRRCTRLPGRLRSRRARGSSCASRRTRSPRRGHLREAAPAALDLLELTELAWHDCYAEITPSEEIINEILLCSEGDLGRLARGCRLAVEDWRDLRVWAEKVRERKGAR